MAAIVAGVIFALTRSDDEPSPEPDTSAAGSPEPVGGTPGDDSIDALSDGCGAADMQACDELYADAPIGSLDESFGATCGERTDGGNPGGCVGDIGVSADAWDDCGAGDMQACDELYAASPVGSLAEAFGAACGGVSDGGNPGGCVVDFGP